jgi:hypothetical protein
VPVTSFSRKAIYIVIVDGGVPDDGIVTGGRKVQMQGRKKEGKRARMQSTLGKTWHFSQVLEPR